VSAALVLIGMVWSLACLGFLTLAVSAGRADALTERQARARGITEPAPVQVRR
jgi:hypothetical protein